MENEKSQTSQEGSQPASPQDSRLDIQTAAKETKEAEESLSEKVEALQDALGSMADEAQAGRGWRRDDYLAAFESLRAQVEEIQKQWGSVSDYIKVERQRVESLLQSFPGIIELSTLHAQSLRLNHLEQLVSELFQELHTKKSETRARKQMIISVVALGVTVVLWGVWIMIAFFK